MRQLKVYIAGPITDNEDFEDDFGSAAYSWRQKGWDVVNPVELDGGDYSRPWRWYMRRDIPLLIDCDAIALLPGWPESEGATLEHEIADSLGLYVYDATHPPNHPQMHPFLGPNKCCLVPEYWHIDFVLKELS